MSPSPAYDRNNIFARILRGELPCKKVYEDEFALAFHDINPLAPVHVLVIPKGEYVSQADFCTKAPPELVVGFWRAAAKVAHDLGLDPEGYRMVANHGPNGGQLVFHFHVHIFGGRAMSHRMGNMPRPDGAKADKKA
jgi:diadenosine tetraphosphate (Ap4A) HIT family hydrolase